MLPDTFSWSLTALDKLLIRVKIYGGFKGTLTLCKQHVGFFSPRKFWSNFFGKLEEKKRFKKTI
jgi:hypothetical protein